ncbi:hypothetical protein F4775DRAFT_564634 [Biscogniauxia sp. FL1348]|nr:hypothetical protein F4775DRAFT_564634 [Biscogniauxia sp. FL1348]
MRRGRRGGLLLRRRRRRQRRLRAAGLLLRFLCLLRYRLDELHGGGGERGRLDGRGGGGDDGGGQRGRLLGRRGLGDARVGGPLGCAAAAGLLAAVGHLEVGRDVYLILPGPDVGGGLRLGLGLRLSLSLGLARRWILRLGLGLGLVLAALRQRNVVRDGALRVLGPVIDGDVGRRVDEAHHPSHDAGPGVGDGDRVLLGDLPQLDEHLPVLLRPVPLVPGPDPAHIALELADPGRLDLVVWCVCRQPTAPPFVVVHELRHRPVVPPGGLDHGGSRDGARSVARAARAWCSIRRLGLGCIVVLWRPIASWWSWTYARVDRRPFCSIYLSVPEADASGRTSHFIVVSLALDRKGLVGQRRELVIEDLVGGLCVQVLGNESDEMMSHPHGGPARWVRGFPSVLQVLLLLRQRELVLFPDKSIQHVDIADRYVFVLKDRVPQRVHEVHLPDDVGHDLLLAVYRSHRILRVVEVGESVERHHRL